MGKRPDLKKKFGFFKWISQQFLTVINGFFSSFRAKKEGNPKWLKLAIQTKIQLCVLPKFGENHHFRSGVVFTPEVIMKHVDRHWKVIQQGTRRNHQSLNVVLQSTSGYLNKKCVAVNMDKSGNCMPRGSKTMKSNKLLCGRAVPCKDEGLEKGNFLNPCITNYIIFYKVVYIEIMEWRCKKCMGICLRA